MEPSVAVYTVSDHRYFPAVAALINSLRLVGHTETVFVLDCGLSPTQRALLEPQATLVPAPQQLATNPTLFKAFPAILEPDGVVAILDSDLIITRSLSSLFDRAAAGTVCAFPDPEADRWFAEWEQVFGLSAPPRRGTYVSAGFLVFSADHWPGLLPAWWDACFSILDHPTLAEGAPNETPTAQADQDALNAILLSSDVGRAVAPLPFEGLWHNWYETALEIADIRSLECLHSGVRAHAAHPGLSPKPWFPAAWSSLFSKDTYTRLLRRLLIAPDVAIRVPDSELPLWLRRGPVGALMLNLLCSLNDRGIPKRVELALRRMRRRLGYLAPS